MGSFSFRHSLDFGWNETGGFRLKAIQGWQNNKARPAAFLTDTLCKCWQNPAGSALYLCRDRWSPHWLQMNLAPPGSWGPRVTDTGPPASLECFGLEHIWVHSPVLTKGHDWDGQGARVRAGGMGPGILSVLPIQPSSAETHWVPARLP